MDIYNFVEVCEDLIEIVKSYRDIIYICELGTWW
jgi:hypothetical protein